MSPSRKSAITTTGDGPGSVNAKMDHILNFIDQLFLANVVRSRIEIVSFSDLVDGGDIEEGKYE